MLEVSDSIQIENCPPIPDDGALPKAALEARK